MRQLLITIIALLPNIASASSYPDATESFLIFLGMGFVGSLVVYFVLGIILALFNKLNVFFMIPVFLVLMGSGFFTIVETAFMQIAGGFPGGFLIGALVSTGIYIYLVKYNQEIDQEELNNSLDKV